MIRYIDLVLVIIFIAVAVIFTAQNSKLVNVKFLQFESIKFPISIIVFFAVIIGIIIGLIYHFYVVYKIKKELKNGKEKIWPV
ncbi:MAG TPA: DUF1049 domain-containing protein [bacterium]|nr:DUF1049 domain-containing protein [bacterium]